LCALILGLVTKNNNVKTCLCKLDYVKEGNNCGGAIKLAFILFSYNKRMLNAAKERTERNRKELNVPDNF
jgi:hypothetical protein